MQLVAQQVAGGPRSYRLQNAYPSVIYNKTTNVKDIYYFCFWTAEDVGPYKHRDNLMLSATDQAKISMSLFTIQNQRNTR